MIKKFKQAQYYKGRSRSLPAVGRIAIVEGKRVKYL